MSPFDQALHDYYYKDEEPIFTLHNNYGNPEEMPVEVFFRDENDYSQLEQIALSFCEGEILDVGACVGAHAGYLQELGMNVTAVETSKEACKILKERGLNNIINNDYKTINNKRFDTLLLLMNGFGLCGTLDNITSFLKSLKRLLKPGGIVIVDSSDVKYIMDEMPKDRYYGEVEFCYEYESIIGDWFPWLYIDSQLLEEKCDENGWMCNIVYTDDNDQYLAILKPN